ncbi:MAG: MBL fold metallo-hydrolase [Oscillospiraceae bacterium]|nr:MBL fold metallo-hydrolase [Oscillospiraceae bacterium]
MLHVTMLPVGSLEANCYLVADDACNAVIIDPGAEASRITEKIHELHLKPTAILLTHAHFDHIGAAAELIEAFQIPLYVHTLDKPMLLSADKNMAAAFGLAQYYQAPKAQQIHCFEDLEILRFSEELTLTVIHTPGHTPGSCCFRHEDILFSGDTLFFEGVGRVDFPGGSVRDMRKSLAKLGALEGDCTVYCGHSECTSLSYERENGHYLSS